MNKEELLYNQIYKKTKDFGRTQFIKEIMNMQRKNQQLKEQNIAVNKGLKKVIIKRKKWKNRYQKVKKQLRQRNEVIEEATSQIKKKIKNSFNYDYGLDASNSNNRLCTETVIELQLILEILTKYKGDDK